MDISNLDEIEKAAMDAGEIHLEEVWDVDYQTLLSIFVAGAMWLAGELQDNEE